MADQLLAWAVVILPTLFALVIEVVSKEIKERPYWRVSIVIFGLGLSALTWLQISRADKTAGKDRENAVIGTAVETSNRVNAKIAENMYTALQEYNKAHPQHPVTSAQFAELTKSLNGSHMQRPAHGIPKELVVDLLHKEALQIRDEWNTYWNDEDQSLATRARYLRQQGTTNEADKAQLQQLVASRETIRTMFDI